VLIQDRNRVSSKGPGAPRAGQKGVRAGPVLCVAKRAGGDLTPTVARKGLDGVAGQGAGWS